jgi:uncharacterized membrane protein
MGLLAYRVLAAVLLIWLIQGVMIYRHLHRAGVPCHRSLLAAWAYTQATSCRRLRNATSTA